MKNSSDIAVVVVSTASCTLSIFGAAAVFATYVFIPEIRNSTRQLVMCLNIADFLTAAGYMISAIAYYFQEEDTVCLPQSIITTFSSLVSFFLTVVIAIHIFVSVVVGTLKTSSRTFYVVANIVSWGVPAAIICAATANKALGKTGEVGTGPWCWVKNDKSINPRLWRYLTGKSWEIQCYIYTMTLYVLLKFYLYLKRRHASLHSINHHLRDEDRNFLYVWFILYLLRLWGTVRFFISDFNLDSTLHNTSEVFLYFQAIGDPGQAFGNFILFCVLDNTVRTKFKDYISTIRDDGICSRLRRNENVHEQLRQPGSIDNGALPVVARGYDTRFSDSGRVYPKSTQAAKPRLDSPPDSDSNDSDNDSRNIL